MDPFDLEENSNPKSGAYNFDVHGRLSFVTPTEARYGATVGKRARGLRVVGGRCTGDARGGAAAQNGVIPRRGSVRRPVSGGVSRRVQVTEAAAIRRSGRRNDRGRLRVADRPRVKGIVRTNFLP